MSNTPTLDKYNLHPFGGRCTCFSDPYSVCTICKRASEQQKRWEALSEEEKAKATKETEATYRNSSNQDGR